MKSFTEDPEKEIWGKSKALGLGEGVLEASYYSSRGRVLPTLVYFYLFVDGFMYLKVSLVVFKRLFGWLYGFFFLFVAGFM